MNFLSLIEAKRDGQILSAEQIQKFVNAYARGNIADYQMAAMLMAIYFRGLNPAETRALTLSMRDSGDVLQFPKDDRPLVDKHSTGGVGDKVSLPLAPLLACLGFRVPMISGRGLGITGGTLDKLESIPGFKTALSAAQIVEQVQTVGCVICGQTDRMVPADKALYALRDVTGTVPSIPLITASILSKKLAENLDALLLDVKFGSAAFMRTQEQARDLARTMVELGKECGVDTRAILTNMNVPLGRTAGNWLEVAESVACLQGKGLQPGGGVDDLTHLVLSCAGELLAQTGQSHDSAAGYEAARECLQTGAPGKKWDEMLAAQGADMDAFYKDLERSLGGTEFRSPRAGFIQACDARIVGEVVRDLGGGRLTKVSKINHMVGIDRMAKPGQQVFAGEVLARVHAANDSDAKAAVVRLESAFTFCDEPPSIDTLVQEVIR